MLDILLAPEQLALRDEARALCSCPNRYSL